jgi:hypothetical protein
MSGTMAMKHLASSLFVPLEPEHRLYGSYIYWSTVHAAHTTHLQPPSLM